MPTGVWLIGARGSVAVSSLVGALAFRESLAEPIGCATELSALRGPALPAWPDLVFGGYDIAMLRLTKKAQALVSAGVLPQQIVELVASELNALEATIRPAPTGGAQLELAGRIAEDLVAFQRQNRLDHTVVVDVSSTEPPAAPHEAHADLSSLRAALEFGEDLLPASSLYAYAAFTTGCSYIEFTPSTGPRLPALEELAAQTGSVYAGSDGKTGETLVKSVLAPMFAVRNLRVRSWSGANLLGGGDGANLARPESNAAKVASKRRVLVETLGYEPEGRTRIDYVPDMDDFKTAWDLISFSGFLGTKMRMEFTWHGCDSALAAPLVLDLVRLAAAAHLHGARGPLRELAFFFKDPIGDVPHGLADQWQLLCDLVAGWVNDRADRR